MMKFEIEKRVEMQDIFFLRKLYAYVHSKEWKMETLDRKKIGMNIKVRRMQKLISQTAMAEKIRDLADTYEQRRSWPRYA